MVQAYKDRADIVSQTNLQTYNADLAATGVRYHIAIYPNPANEALNIKVPNTNKFEIKLMDATGKTVFEDKDKNQINTSKISNGVYYLILKTSKQSIMETVIIKH